MLSGESAGKIDAAWSRDQAAAAGITDLECVYFACDFDIQPGQYAAADAYLQGAASVLGVSKVGTYGGYAWVTHCRAAGLAAFLWQTGAWSYTLVANGINIYQHIGTVYVSGVPCDYSTVYKTDYGQHPRAVAPPVTPPPPVKDWFDMATKADLQAVVKAELDAERESYAKRTLSYIRANGLVSVQQHQLSQGEQIQALQADVNDLKAALAKLLPAKTEAPESTDEAVELSTKIIVPDADDDKDVVVPSDDDKDVVVPDDEDVARAESEGLPPVPEAPAATFVSGATNV
jgi:hypothetical protein